MVNTGFRMGYIHIQAVSPGSRNKGMGGPNIQIFGQNISNLDFCSDKVGRRVLTAPR